MEKLRFAQIRGCESRREYVCLWNGSWIEKGLLGEIVPCAGTRERGTGDLVRVVRKADVTAEDSNESDTDAGVFVSDGMRVDAWG